MSVLVVGLSYQTAPVPVLEKTSVSADDTPKILGELQAAEAISEVLLLSTCNRIEVYADVDRFHPAVAEITNVLARHAGLSVTDLVDHLYVHFAEAAVEHVFSVASGLDSMVVGESQILGQLRLAYANGTAAGTVRTVLHELVQQGLRVGKRVHTDTGIDRAGASIVSVALENASRVLGPLSGKRALIIGAGSMGALAGATLSRLGVRDFVVANRSVEGGQRLAQSLGGRAVTLDHLSDVIADADLIISCTGATGLVVELEHFAARAADPQVVLDLALPHDVDPQVATLPGVTYVDLDSLRADGALVSDSEVRLANNIVAQELIAYLKLQQQLAVAPTVSALRERANEVISAELLRLDSRLPALDEATRREVSDAVRRAVEKVLHAPTVRVKELASTPGGDQYAQALRDLFDLDAATAESVLVPRAGREKKR
ncbi:glutamyl-tRNA reductase [Jatrophihabitans sp. GAS493]|uniref:glutamyl-tRNA reductase n=1 Tax=Jatrophihabitans sp. GAS493 TaxID=1907575 RepID=UPI000BB90355|nr:glutamyl-tRNA reductase [Jatrophihabitans sp. GAS493]SOD70654.1 glutamyl-tRNA reductase [Jatrophihabitans sp. GAS493]